MSTQVQRRKGTTAQHASFTGASAELTVDTTKNTVVVHDGATAGGIPLAKETGSAISATSLTLPNGTANAVAFLNSSKVLTSGTALTFDGTNFATTGAVSATTQFISLNSSTGEPSVAGNFRILLDNVGGVANDTGMGLDASSYLWANTGTGFRWTITAAEQMRLTSTGLGIGTSSPLQKLHVSGIARVAGATNGANGDLQLWSVNAAGSGFCPATISNISTGSASSALTFSTSASGTAAEVMRLDASGNLGIGTNAPGAILHTIKTSAGAATVGAFIQNSDTTAGTEVRLAFAANINTLADNRYGWIGYVNTGGVNGGALTFATTPGGQAAAERMRLDASGNLLVGATVTNLIGGGFSGTVIQASGRFDINRNNDCPMFVGRYTSTGSMVEFYYAGALKGSISTNGTTIAYNTSSDYRLKNITGPITTSGAYIDSLKPVEGTWKADGATFVGLIAHETQEASRTTVATGAKDGDEMQGMDYSSAEIIANLIAELQDLRKRLAAAGIA